MPKCNILENHMRLGVNSAWSPCCIFDVSICDPAHSARTMSFAEYKNSSDYTQLKDVMNSGEWHHGCKECRYAESVGAVSWREKFNSQLSGTPNKIEYLELSLSNECNLSCVFCSSTASSKWDKLASMYDELTPFQHRSGITTYTYDFDKLFGDICLEDIKIIKLLGGEPFITPQSYELFDYLDRHNVIQNIDLRVNTNCTYFPTKALSQLKKFKSLAISFSIDAIGSYNDFIRMGSDWNVIQRCMKQWIELSRISANPVYFRLASVMSAININSIVGCAAYSNSMFGNEAIIIPCDSPKYLSIEAMPKEYYLPYLDEMQKWPELIRTCNYIEQYEYSPELNSKLKEYIITIEKISGLDIQRYSSIKDYF